MSKLSKKIPKPKPAQCLAPCECGAKHLVTLIPGRNDIHFVCHWCNANLHICIDYDGYGMATIQAGTIEKVQE